MADRAESKGVARLLLHASRLLIIIAVVLAGALLTAGTFTYGNPRRPLTLALGLRELSLASVRRQSPWGYPYSSPL